jgi:hypothetical protein
LAIISVDPEAVLRDQPSSIWRYEGREASEVGEPILYRILAEPEKTLNFRCLPSAGPIALHAIRMLQVIEGAR